MRNLKDKIVLITGSSIGIGRETAKAFYKEGAKPIITYYKDEDKAKELANDLNTKSFFLDVREEKSIKLCIDNCLSEFGNIDILINNAGVIYWKPLMETSLKEIDEQIDVNLKGLIKMTKLVLEKSNPELIINIASGASKTAYPSLATYCSTKFGVRGFSYSLMQEIDCDIRIINPRSTKTRMTNFKGDDPKDVAQVILKTAKNIIKEKEVDVWNYL